MEDAIARIERYAARGREVFFADELIQTWIVHHLEILGEAARALAPELKARYPKIPWKEIGAMRNLLIHSYFRVDPQEVWAVVERDLPALKQQIANVIADFEPPSGDVAR